MAQLILTALLFMPDPGVDIILPAPVCPVSVKQIEGWGGWSYYDKGPTDRMLSIWESYGYDLEEYDAFIAISDCSLRGKTATIRVEDGKPIKALIYDCAGSIQTACWMAKNEILGELDYYTVKDLGIYGRGTWGYLDLPYVKGVSVRQRLLEVYNANGR